MNIRLGHFKISLGHTSLKTAAEGTFTVLGLFSLMLVGAYFSVVEKNNSIQVAAASFALPAHVEAPAIEAHSAIVYDARDGKVLYEKNSTDIWPLASLTKLMTAEAVLAHKAESAPITIVPDDLLPDGDSGLVVGDTWTLRNLLTFGLVESSNDAMAAVAGSVGSSTIVGIMNDTAQTLGLKSMRFENPTGLDVTTEEAGAYGSASDIALLAADFLKRYPEYFNATVAARTAVVGGGKNIEAKPTALPILDIPGLIGAKTGYTDLAGGNLVAAFDLEVGHPVIVVVLGSSIDGRFSDVRALIGATRAAAAK